MTVNFKETNLTNTLLTFDDTKGMAEPIAKNQGILQDFALSNYCKYKQYQPDRIYVSSALIAQQDSFNTQFFLEIYFLIIDEDRHESWKVFELEFPNNKYSNKYDNEIKEKAKQKIKEFFVI